MSTVTEQDRVRLCEALVFHADNLRGSECPAAAERSQIGTDACSALIEAEACIVLLAEDVKALQRWKDEALGVERQWDVQAIGKLIGANLGQHIRPQIQPAIENLIKLVDALRAKP